MAKAKTVDLVVNLGDLKPALKRAARASGITMNEFVCDALKSTIRREQEYQGRESYVRHGGKHLMGKHTGYEVTAEGNYYPAPSWTEQFELLFAERGAVYNLMNMLVTQSEGRLREIEKRLRQTTKNLVDDLGLDPQEQWAYYGGEQCLRKYAKDDGEPKK